MTKQALVLGLKDNRHLVTNIKHFNSVALFAKACNIKIYYALIKGNPISTTKQLVDYINNDEKQQHDITIIKKYAIDIHNEKKFKSIIRLIIKDYIKITLLKTKKIKMDCVYQQFGYLPLEKYTFRYCFYQAKRELTKKYNIKTKRIKPGVYRITSKLHNITIYETKI